MLDLLIEDIFFLTDHTVSRRGRPPGSAAAAKMSKKLGCAEDDIERGLLMHLAEDQDALRNAGHVLKQKLARQKRKPKRLADDSQLPDLSPRSCQVPHGCFESFTCCPHRTSCTL